MPNTKPPTNFSIVLFLAFCGRLYCKSAFYELYKYVTNILRLEGVLLNLQSTVKFVYSEKATKFC